MRDARAGLNAIASELDLRPDGLVDVRREEVAPPPPPRLLGPFDPLLLGWCSRAFVLDTAEDVITNNGIIRAIALVGGRAAGTWTMSGGRVALQLWKRPTRPVSSALEREAAAVQAYLESR